MTLARTRGTVLRLLSGLYRDVFVGKYILLCSLAVLSGLLLGRNLTWVTGAVVVAGGNVGVGGAEASVVVTAAVANAG